MFLCWQTSPMDMMESVVRLYEVGRSRDTEEDQEEEEEPEEEEEEDQDADDNSDEDDIADFLGNDEDCKFYSQFPRGDCRRRFDRVKKPVFRIRIHMFLGLPDPLVVVCIRIRILLSSCKNSKKNLDSYYFVTLFDFLSLKNYLNVPPSKSNKQKKLC